MGGFGPHRRQLEPDRHVVEEAQVDTSPSISIERCLEIIDLNLKPLRPRIHCHTSAAKAQGKRRNPRKERGNMI
jgi:hypothetical protein